MTSSLPGSLTQNAIVRGLALILALLLLSPNALPLAVSETIRRADEAAAGQDFTAAADALDEAAARLPYDGTLAYRAGLANLNAGRFDDALKHLNRADALNAWPASLRVAVGDAYWGKGDRAAAIAQWERALAELPDDDALLARLAESYETVGRFEDALAMGERRLQHGATEPRALYRLALITAALSPAEALARLRVVADLPSEYASPANTLLQSIQAAQREQDEAYTFGRVGYELIQVREWALAERALTQAVALNPNYADAQAYLGLALDEQAKDGEAAFQRAAALAPDSALVQYLFGLHYRRRGESAQALPYLEAAQKLDPQNPALAAEIGGAYAAQNDLPNAEIWFTRAVELAPNDAQFWLLLARFHVDYEWKVAELGLPAARMAVGLNPESALAADALGYALIVTGDFVNGQKSLERALAIDPNLASAYYHFGLFYAIQNRAEEAQAVLNHVLALDPEGPYGKLALKVLALISP